jgi:tetratricopeptide (TPR) repeat protein
MAGKKKSQPPSAPAPVSATETPLWRWLAAAAASLALVLELYSPALRGPFLLDDGFQMFGRPGAENWPLSLWINNVRPLLNFTFFINFKLSGVETFSYHALNVILHWANSWLLFFALRRIWQIAGGAGTLPPAFAAALFLLHPLQTESVAYISSRSETLSVLLAYSALAVFFCRDRESPISFSRAGVILALMGAAVLTKEHTVAVPAVFLLADYFWTTPFQWTAIRRNWRLYAILAAGAGFAALFVARTLRYADTAGFGLKDLPWNHYFFTQWRMFWRYLRMVVLPAGLNADPDIAVSRSITDEFSWLAGLAIAGLLAACWWFRKTAPLAAFGVLAFALLLAPTSSVVPIRDLFAERRMYLPFVGIACIALEVFRRWKIPAWAPALILALCALLTYQRAHAWGSALEFWKDTVANSPEKQRPQFQLAFVHYSEGRCAEAAAGFDRAARLGPADDALYIDWALALECAGQPDQALEKLHLAAKQKESAHLRAVMAMVYAKAGRADDALQQLDLAEKRNPRFAMTYVYRGHIFAQRGEVQAAADQYRRALSHEPSNSAALQGLAALNAARQ